MKNLVLFFLFLVVIIYLAKKTKLLKSVLPSVDGVLDHFNWSRKLSKKEEQTIKDAGNKLYRSEREEMIKSGAWKFPNMKCADMLAKKYGLDEFKRDGLATYNTFEKVAEKLEMVTRGKVKLAAQEVKNLCESS